MLWLQTNNHYTEIPSAPRYSSLFKGYCFSCNNFGHKAVDFNRRKIRKTYHDPYAPFSGHIRCYSYNKFGHVETKCRNRPMNHQSQYGRQTDDSVRSKKDGLTNVHVNNKKEE